MTIIQPVIDVTLVNEDSETLVYAVDENNLVVVEDDGSILVYEQDEPVIIQVAGTIGPAGPQGPTGPQGPSGGDEVPLSKRVDFNIDGNLAYIGEANPGTLDSAASWRIKYLEIFSDDDVAITWASGNDNFDKIWDNRTGYTYS